MIDGAAKVERFLCSYAWDGRSLKRFITGLLRSETVLSVRRINYVKSYSLVEKQILTKEEKMLLISYDVTQKQKLESFFVKHHPLGSLVRSILFLDSSMLAAS